MNSLFSVDDFSDLLWQGPIPSPAMSRSPSDWELDNFLQDFPVSVPAPASSTASNNSVSRPPEVSQSSTSSKPQNVHSDVVEIRKPGSSTVPHNQPNSGLNCPIQPSDRAQFASPDSDEYRAFLKSQLDLACAAAAKARGSGVKPEANSSVAEDQGTATKNRQLESQISGNGLNIPEIPKSPSEGDDGSRSIPALPTMQKKQEVQARQTTSGSSREDSDDDELDGALGPSDEKRARRMQSNRESARRSRRRKQAQLNELETQVGQLRDERTTLLTRLTDINKKCEDASVDNRILNANIETLRTKVKMAEDQVKRATGLNPLLLARPNMPSMGMQFGAGQTENVPLPMQPNNNHYFHHSVPNIPSVDQQRHIQRPNNGRPDSHLAPLTTNPQADNRTSNIGAVSAQQLPGTHLNMPDVPPIQHVHSQTGPAVNKPRDLPAFSKVDNQPVNKDNMKK